MTRRPVLLAVPLVLGAVVAGAATAAPPAPSAVAATPLTCDAGVPSPDGRVFPEPAVSPGWLRLVDFECGIAQLEEQFPDMVQVTTTGTSKEGHPVYDVLLTDETVKAPKRKLLVASPSRSARGRRTSSTPRSSRPRTGRATSARRARTCRSSRTP